MTPPGSEPGPPDPETDALTTRPPRLRGIGEERKGGLELSERREKGREKEGKGKGGGKVQLGEEPPPAVCEFLDSPLYTLQYSA